MQPCTTWVQNKDRNKNNSSVSHSLQYIKCAHVYVLFFEHAQWTKLLSVMHVFCLYVHTEISITHNVMGSIQGNALWAIDIATQYLLW